MAGGGALVAGGVCRRAARQLAAHGHQWVAEMAGAGVHGLLGALLSTDNDTRTKAEVRSAVVVVVVVGGG